MRIVPIMVGGLKYELQFTCRFLEEGDLYVLEGAYLGKLRRLIQEQDLSWQAVCMREHVDLLVVQCHILGGVHNMPLCKGIAVKMPGEPFMFLTGAKLALGRALRGQPSRTFSQAVWDAFLTHYQIPHRNVLPPEPPPVF